MPRFDTSFNFGANGKPKKAKSSGGRKRKRQLSAAQKYTAQMYMKPRGRR
jgi:hypothetical protein